MFGSYSDSLNELKKSIPDDYKKKDKLVETIDYCLVDMSYKAPELLSLYFCNYCKFIIPHLPKDRKQNSWVNKPWENIHKVAKDNKILLEKKNLI